MKTKGNFKEMAAYAPYVYFDSLWEHFDVVVKVRKNDAYDSSPVVTHSPAGIIFTLNIVSAKRKYRGHELLYIKQIPLPPGIAKEQKIVVTINQSSNIGTDTGGTTVVRYGDVPPPSPQV